MAQVVSCDFLDTFSRKVGPEPLLTTCLLKSKALLI